MAVPDSTPAFICERLRGYGAEVTVHGSQWSEANAFATRLAEQSGGVLIHPFEGEDTWEVRRLPPLEPRSRSSSLQRHRCV